MLETRKEEKSAKYWVGLDVSKKTFDASIMGSERKADYELLPSLPANSFARTPEGVQGFLDWLDTRVDAGDVDGVRCVMEVTGKYSIQLARWLSKARPSLRPAIEAGWKTAAFMKSLGTRTVTDKLAARCLAVYGRDREPRPYTERSAHEEQLCEVSRYRDALVKERAAMKNRGSELGNNGFVKTNHKKRLELLEKDIKRAEAEMHRLVDASPRVKADVDLLTTIRGVGFVTAVVVLVEVGDLRRFRQARTLSAYVGLNPAVRQSGTSVHGKAHLSKRGNARVRQALYLSAWSLIQAKSSLQRGYTDMVERGKNGKVAMGALMRKLLCVMRAILISGKPYDPEWKKAKTPAAAPA